ncbi:MAG: methyltransferase domain-containing protein [Alphaproteobacteria bacterium]
MPTTQAEDGGKSSSVESVTKVVDPAEKKARYDNWAETYNTDLTDDYGYQAPLITAELMASLLPRDSRVLDAGCGTGLLGIQMAAQGFDHLFGCDYSENMMAVAKRAGIYGALEVVDLSARLPYDDNSFEAVVSVGLPAIVPGRCIQEFARITRADGHVFYCSGHDQFVSSGYESAIAELDGRLVLKEITNPKIFPAYTKVDDPTAFVLRAYQVKMG